ncbi:hypothetical protein OA57_08855 [Chelonobacter oris]|uniref:DUF2572 family protein n=2 Tax=Chelonobacter oris TaxID=505317 RepID=A0A0A3ARP8_9PAST|nr:hypothetical protein OA57_08855 [Chelonobacter oris]
MIRMKKGLVTLWSLLILASVLCLFLWRDGEILALQRANMGERWRYLQQREPLLTQSIMPDSDELCRQAAAGQSAVSSFRIEFVLPANASQRHYLLCRRHSLFKRLPQQALQQGVADFVQNPESWQPLTLPLSKADYAQRAVLWLKTDSEWVMEADFYGIVLAEADLQIRGEGTIFGAVIHNGKVLLGERNRLVFQPHLLEKIAAEHQQWRYQAGSWHDFDPL